MYSICTTSEEAAWSRADAELANVMDPGAQPDRNNAPPPRRPQVLYEESVWKLLHVLVATAAGGVMFGAID